jgi:hypothetical protein
VWWPCGQSVAFAVGQTTPSHSGHIVRHPPVPAKHVLSAHVYLPHHRNIQQTCMFRDSARWRGAHVMILIVLYMTDARVGGRFIKCDHREILGSSHWWRLLIIHCWEWCCRSRHCLDDEDIWRVCTYMDMGNDACTAARYGTSFVATYPGGHSSLASGRGALVRICSARFAVTADGSRGTNQAAARCRHRTRRQH